MTDMYFHDRLKRDDKYAATYWEERFHEERRQHIRDNEYWETVIGHLWEIAQGRIKQG